MKVHTFVHVVAIFLKKNQVPVPHLALAAASPSPNPSISGSKMAGSSFSQVTGKLDFFIGKPRTIGRLLSPGTYVTAAAVGFPTTRTERHALFAFCVV